MSNPRVSIITVTYNRSRFIRRAIESAIDQTMRDWELIVADDSTNDEIERIVAPFAAKDRRIHYFHRSIRGSVANGSNFALAKAKGEFVAILDDDDWWRDPEKLKKQVAFLDEHPDYIGCGSWAVIVNDEGKEEGIIKKPMEDMGIRHAMLTANAIVNSTAMFRRVPAGFYDETLPQFNDWDFWLRLGKVGKLYNFPENFLSYRIGQESASRASPKENVKASFTIIRRYRHDYPGYGMAFLIASSYWVYAQLPFFIRKRTSSFLSKLKKRIFSGWAPMR